MWTIDLYGDPTWIIEHYKEGPCMSHRTTFKDKLGTSPEMKIDFFGDQYGVKHVRMMGEITSKQEVESFINRFVYKYMRNLEIFISTISDQPFYFWKLPNYPYGVLSYGEVADGQENIPLRIEVNDNKDYQFDYNALRNLLSNTFPTFHRYAYFLQHGIDLNLPLDYRWLNLYKICEMRFNEDGKGLAYSKEWAELLEKFYDDLKPYLKSKQKPAGFLEQLRTLAAHSVSRGGGAGFGHHEGYEAQERLEQTVLILHRIVHEVINTLPDNNGRLKFFVKDQT